MEKRHFHPPWCHQTLAPFHLWLFSYLISDLSLSSAHWRWGLHLSTHWVPICFWIIWDPDTLLVTKLIDMGRFCVHFAFHWNHWQPGTVQEVRKSEQIRDVPLKMFHGTDFRCWDVLCPTKAASRSCLCPLQYRDATCALISPETPWLRLQQFWTLELNLRTAKAVGVSKRVMVFKPLWKSN